MLVLDGRRGEGGGQILRSALALSLATGRPFRMHDIRGGRARPGLLRQHLTCVRAAQEIGAAEVSGATIGSDVLTFAPHSLRGGAFRFAVGSAGSTALVVQSVLAALLSAGVSASLSVEGGTHAIAAPIFSFLDDVYLGALRRVGADVSANLGEPGFFPAGGGEMSVELRGGAPVSPFCLLDRGPILSMSAHALVAGLPARIARDELEVLRDRLGILPRDCSSQVIRRAHGPGNALWVRVTVEVDHQPFVAVFSSIGRRGVPAEQVAAEVADAVARWDTLRVPVCEHLADQLLLPMALGAGGQFRTGPLSSHTRTNIETIRLFLPGVLIHTEAEANGAVRVAVTPTSERPSLRS